ncbi:MAG: hypothetical protein ACI9GO_000854, partial [Bacteroidia bacterium]
MFVGIRCHSEFQTAGGSIEEGHSCYLNFFLDSCFS